METPFPATREGMATFVKDLPPDEVPSRVIKERFHRSDDPIETFCRAIAARHSLTEIWSMPDMPTEADIDARMLADNVFKQNFWSAVEIRMIKEALKTIELADDLETPTADRQLQISARRALAEKVVPRLKSAFVVEHSIGDSIREMLGDSQTIAPQGAIEADYAEKPALEEPGDGPDKG